MDPARLALYASLAPVEVLRAGRAWTLAALHPDLAPAGTLGAPGGEPADHDAALAAGEAWLAARGCRRVLGPMEVCTWFPYRANLGPHRIPPFPGEPDAAPDPWIARGYAEIAAYDSLRVDHRPQLDAFEPAGEAVAAAGLRVAPYDPSGPDLDDARDLVHAAFASAFAFVSLPRPAFRALHGPLLAALDPGLLRTARAPDGRLVGLCLAWPHPPSGTVVVKTLAVDPAWQGVGLGRWLLALTHRAALARGLDRGLLHALMWAGSRSQAMAREGVEEVRRYALYARDLAP